MNAWGRTREVEKPKAPRRIVVIEIWDNPASVLGPTGAYRAHFGSTDYRGYGDTIARAVSDMFDRILADAVKLRGEA